MENPLREHGSLEQRNPLYLEDKGRGCFAKALEVASCSFKLQGAIRELNKGYWAASTLAVKTSRREEVTILAALARTISGVNQFLPLQKELVESVAAALKAAGLASADQYLNKLKLMHIEAGSTWNSG